ncbi:MAG: Teneurin-1, partial [Kribbellaceae bacterium]|nr:Teneurin-1 [Kribbellaceae bacterium]
MSGRSMHAARKSVALLFTKRRRPVAARLGRRVILVTIFALVLGVAAPGEAKPAEGGFPANWFTDLAFAARAWAAGGPSTPKQGHGKLPDRGDYVSQKFVPDNDKTRRAKHELAQFAPHRPASATRTANPGKGFDAATSKRIASAATDRSDVYQNADGSYTRRVYARPVNYKAADGTWKPIDSNLRRGADGRLGVTANSLGMTYAGTAGQDLVQFSPSSGQQIAYSLTGAQLGTPVVDRQVATYTGVFPNVDLTLGAMAGGSKETLILHSADVPDAYVFPLTTTGLTARLNADGGLEFVDAKGAVAARMPVSFMEDSATDKTGSGALSYGVRYELTTVDGRQALKMTIDRAWLADPARRFPVKLDPTLATNNNDVYVQTGTTTNRVSEDNFAVGTFDSGTNKARSLVPFPNFATTYAGKKITAAGLNLFMSYQGVGTSCVARAYNVQAVTSAWTPGSTIAWANFPTYGSVLGSASPSSTAACNNSTQPIPRNVGVWSRTSLSVTPFNDWLTGGNNYGLAVTSASETDSLAWKRFTSANPNLICTHATYGSIQCDPFLDVTYTDNVAPQVDERYPATNTTVGSLTPELLASGSDPDNWPAKGLRYNFLLYDASGNQLTTSGWLSTGQWKVPAGTLSWNQTYLYAVQVNDFSSTGPAAPVPYAFTTVVPQAAITGTLAQNGGKGFEPNAGNYTTSDTDAQVATTGPALTITRDYNSLDTRTASAFGRAWSSILDMQATESADAAGALQTVSVRYPSGQDVAFGRNPNGQFVAPMGRFSVFKAITGGYSLTDKDDTVYEFTRSLGSGRYGITKLTDANNRSMAFDYDANGRISAMRSVPIATATNGRKLTIGWSQPSGSAQWHVATVTTDPSVSGDSSTALTWNYTYDTDKHTTVCPKTQAGQQAACTGYQYTLASQHASSVLNTTPYAFWRLNEAVGANTAISSVLSNDGTDGAAYSNVALGEAGPLANSTSTSARFDGSTSSIALPVKTSGKSAYQSVSMWFKTSTAGGVLFSYQRDAVTPGATSPGNYNPVLYIGTDGKLRGELYANNSTTPITTSAAVTDGNWHHVAIAGNGGSQTLYLDGQAAGTMTAPIVLYTADLPRAYIGAGFLGGAWPAQPNTSPAVASFFNGSIADVAFHNRALTGAEASAIYNSGVAGVAELSQVTSPGGRVTAGVAYDSVSGRVKTVTDENGGTWQVGAPTAGGSSQVYVSSVLGSQPNDYWRLADVEAPTNAVNRVLSNIATYHNVTFDTTQPNSTSPFSDSFGAGFNGTSSYLEINDTVHYPDGTIMHEGTDYPYENPASIEMWFKTPANQATSGVLYSYQASPVVGWNSADGNWTPALYIGNDGYLRGEIWTASVAPLTSATKVNDGNWHHVVLTASTSKQTLYLDGKSIGTRTGTLTPTSAIYSFIGAGATRSWPASSGDVSFFKGNISEFAYYNEEITAAEVSAHFQASRSAIQPGQNTTGSTLTPVSTVSITDPTNKVSKQVFDVVNGGRMVASTDTLGNTSTYGYDIGGFESIVFDPIGQKTITGRDVRGNTVRSTVCDRQDWTDGCATTYYAYGPDSTTTNLPPDARNDQVTDIRDPRSASETDNTYRTHFDYDTAGNRIKMTTPPLPEYPAGRVTNVAYTDATTVAQGGGTPPAGLPRQTTSPAGAVQTTEYYPSGDVFRVTDAGGLATEYTYDGLGRVATKTVKAGGTTGDLVTTYQYDSDGQVTQQVEPPVLNRVTGATHTATTTTTYDDDGNVLSRSVTDSVAGGDTARAVQTWYDNHGRMIKSVDPAGQVTLNEYDAYGNITKTTACDSSPAPGDPCPSGDRLRVMDTTWDSEGHQLVTTLTGADGTSTVISRKSYYPTGNLAADRDAMGWDTLYEYDNSDHVTKVSRTDGTSTFVAEENLYQNGFLIERKSDNGATHSAFEYDASGRIVSSG